MAVQAKTILESYPDLIAHLDGDLLAVAEKPCSQTTPIRGGLAYVADIENLNRLLDSEISVLIVHEKISTQAKEKNQGRKTLLITPNTYLCMALVNKKFFSLPYVRAPFEKINIHPTAVVAATAQLAEGVMLGPYAVISENVKIGRNTYVGAQSVIEPESALGDECFIHPHVYVGHNCRIGHRVEIKPHSTIASDGFGYAHDAKGQHHRIPHYGAVIIEDDVHIGANVNIDRGTFDPAIIGAGTKIDNHCHLGHNIKIGKNCLITAGIIVAGSTTIGDNCVFGGRVTVNGHIEITSGCTIGPLSGVNNNVTEPGVYGGYPLTSFRESLKTVASLVHVPRIRKNLARVMRQLGLKDELEKD